MEEAHFGNYSGHPDDAYTLFDRFTYFLQYYKQSIHSQGNVACYFLDDIIEPSIRRENSV